MWVARLFAFAFLFCIASLANAQTPRKVALVIGNSDYANAAPLTNPVNDARLVESALRQAGFSTVETATNLGIHPFQSALREFAARARGADIALIYFAGHGMETDGQNWLIPTDAKLASDTDLRFEAIRLEDVLVAVEGARVRVVMLDACRDNPFVRGMRQFSSTRSVSRGLAAPTTTPDDILIMYAAAVGQTAADGGRNSPFALALAKWIPEPGVDVRQIAGKVRDDVLSATQRRQNPFTTMSLPGTSVFLGRPGAPVAEGTTAVLPRTPPTDRQKFVMASGFVRSYDLYRTVGNRFLCIRPQNGACDYIVTVQTISHSSVRWVIRGQFRSGTLSILTGYSNFDADGLACQETNSIRASAVNPQLTAAQVAQVEQIIQSQVNGEDDSCSGYVRRGDVWEETTFGPTGRQRGSVVPAVIMTSEPRLRPRG